MKPTKILKKTYRSWKADKMPQMAAALAFYAILSLAPLLVFTLTIASNFFSEQSVRNEMINRFEIVMGRQMAENIHGLLTNTQTYQLSSLGALIGALTLIYGATGVFSQIRTALHIVWRVKPYHGRGFSGFMKSQIFPFGMLVGSGLMFVLVLSLSSIVSFTQNQINQLFYLPIHLTLFNYLGTFAALVVVTTFLFRHLSRENITLKEAAIGAAGTTILFLVGKFIFGWYIAQTNVGSAFGATGSLVAILLWIYYSASIFYFGAELTKAYAQEVDKKEFN